MTLRIDRASIAKAMRDAAWKAKHGTREEQSGRFIPAKPARGTVEPSRPKVVRIAKA